jgi:hypothetical protein
MKNSKKKNAKPQSLMTNPNSRMIRNLILKKELIRNGKITKSIFDNPLIKEGLP